MGKVWAEEIDRILHKIVLVSAVVGSSFVLIREVLSVVPLLYNYSITSGTMVKKIELTTDLHRSFVYEYIVNGINYYGNTALNKIIRYDFRWKINDIIEVRYSNGNYDISRPNYFWDLYFPVIIFFLITILCLCWCLRSWKNVSNNANKE